MSEPLRRNEGSIEAERDRMRDGLRLICSKLNSFRYNSPVEVLIDARVALTGLPREEIEAEHTIKLTGAEAESLLALMKRPAVKGPRGAIAQFPSSVKEDAAHG